MGTKLLLAQETGSLDTVGIDLVAMSVNDVLTIGARPILFLDYVAVGRLAPAEMAQIVAGVAEGCRQAGCALVGGEMAEMPGLYDPGEFDLAGFCVGWRERQKLSTGPGRRGRRGLGLASSGLHSNGFSLVRKVLEVNGAAWATRSPASRDQSPTCCSSPRASTCAAFSGCWTPGCPSGHGHITGGGMAGNLARVIPDGLTARLDFSEWQVPPVFRALQELGGISRPGDVPDLQHGRGLRAGAAAGSRREATARLTGGGRAGGQTGRDQRATGPERPR